VSLDASRAWWRRAEAVIPLGTQTLSKSPTQWVQGAAPIFIQRGEGAHVWDVDDNEYIDYPMALGPIILGYRNPAVDEAIRRQLTDGITFTLMHPLEVEVAERITRLCPGVEAVRFAKSGSDAVSGAVRAARAITGRDLVLVAGYHGWHDWYIGSTTRDLGVPVAVQGLTRTFTYNDLDDLDRKLRAGEGAVAAVTLEPSGAETPNPGYLKSVIDLAHEHQALVVFDEVITGFRLAPGGARERYGVEPDLSCYGKALGNGMPIAAVAGRWPVMRAFEDVFFSGTHGGETLSLAASAAVLDELTDGTVLAGINRLGRTLLDGFTAAVDRHDVARRVRISGEPERTVVSFGGDDHLVTKSWVQQCLAQDGILFNGSMFICARHSAEDIERTVASFDRALDALADDAELTDRLVGAPVQPVFRAP
jgi:glutamate-1-semialdehyde aminotransferase